MGFLGPRELSNGASCNQIAELAVQTENDVHFVGNLSFHHFNMILSGSCTACTCLLSISLMAMHVCRFSNPNEQVKVMRIVNMLPSYSILSFISIWHPAAYVYLTGWVEVFQAIALYAYLMLCVDFLAPRDQDKVDFFASLKVRKSFKKGKFREGLSWFKLTYYSVVQYPFVVFICAVVSCLTQAFDVYCLISDSPKFAHIWVEVFTNPSVSFAINAIFRFYMNTKKYWQEKKPMMKLLASKLMVGLIFFEQILFMVLEATKVLHATDTISYADIHIGLPNMIICIQMVPFALFMHFAYDTKPYMIEQNLSSKIEPQESDDEYEGLTPSASGRRFQHRSYQGGLFGLAAWAMYINPFEMIRDGIAVTRLLHHVKIRKQTYEDHQEIPMESKTQEDLHVEPIQEVRPTAATNDQSTPLTERPSNTANQPYSTPTLQPYDQPMGGYGYPDTSYSHASSDYCHGPHSNRYG